VKFIWLTLLVVYCGVIFYLSHQSSLPTPRLFPHQDKLFHATAYGILGFLAFAYFKQLFAELRTALVIALVFSALYGASDEWHQSFVVGRDADIFDWFADCLGATLVINVMKRFSAKKQTTIQ